MIRGVETQAVDIPIQATVRVRESLWKQVKIEAIRRGCTVGEMVEIALLGELAPKDKKERKA